MHQKLRESFVNYKQILNTVLLKEKGSLSTRGTE